MKFVALAFASVVLLVPGRILPTASPSRAAVLASVRNLDGNGEPFGDPFVQEVTVDVAAGQISSEGTPFSVPAGKLLIVEFVSVIETIAPGSSQGAFALIRITDGSTVHDHYLLMTKLGAFGADYFVASQNVRLYAPAGSTVNLIVGRNNDLSVEGGAGMTLTGRLISP